MTASQFAIEATLQALFPPLPPVKYLSPCTPCPHGEN